jgi:2'-5' RNA ligase
VVQSQRVFIALWPPSSVRARLAEVAADVGPRFPEGRPIRAENLHLTLAFVGSLHVDRVIELSAEIERFRIEPFVWTIDRLGAFNRARVLWVGGNPTPALERLAIDVRTLLDHLRVPFDRKPFAAHVTLIRDMPRTSEANATIDPPISWPCERPTLVRSQPGDRARQGYVPLTRT